MNNIIKKLQAKIRSVETENRRENGEVVKNACTAIDQLLPEQGYPRGTLVQWITRGGQGAEYLSLKVAQQACLNGGALVIIDPRKEFFPPAAAAMGIELDNMIILQSSNETDLLWGIDQSLRCPAVAAVWGTIESIDERWFRRFQLSAESSGALGLFLQPLLAAKQPSWAEVQWLVGASSTEPGRKIHSASDSALRHVSLQLARCRSAHAGRSLQLTIDPVSGNIQPNIQTNQANGAHDESLSFTKQSPAKQSPAKQSPLPSPLGSTQVPIPTASTNISPVSTSENRLPVAS